MAFSFDGDYLAALGSLPNFQISIWEWKSNSLLCCISNEISANSISFNPLNALQFCTSGERIKIWKMKPGLKKYGIQCMYILFKFYIHINILNRTANDILDSSIEDDSSENKNSIFKAKFKNDKDQLNLQNHTWSPDGNILSSSPGINHVIKVDSTLGKCTLLGPEIQQEINESNLEDPANGDLLKTIIPLKTEILCTGSQGTLSIYGLDGQLKRSVQILPESDFISCKISPDYKMLLLETSQGCLYSYHLIGNDLTLHVGNDMRKISHFQYLKPLDVFVSSDSNTITVWNAKTLHVLSKSVVTTSKITGLAASPSLPLLAVGTELGFVRFYTIESNFSLKLIKKYRIHSKPVEKLNFEPNGRFLSTLSNDDCLYFYDTTKTFAPIGFLTIEGIVHGSGWLLEEDEEDNISLHFFVQTIDHEKHCSFIYRITIPNDKDLSSLTSGNSRFMNSVFSVIFTFNLTLNLYSYDRF